MKKSVIGILLIVSVLLVSCVEYKPTEEQEDLTLIDEIAKIEEELAQEPEVVEEEVVIPDLEEEPVQSEVATTISVKENEMVRLSLKVADPDEDPVTYTFSKPLDNNGEWKTNYGDAGEYMVTIVATDGKLSTEKKVKLVVERVNVKPIIAGVKDITVKEGETVNFEPEVTDPNNDAVTVTVSEPLASGTFTTDHTSAGVYPITVSASDGELETTATFQLTVNNVNVKPEISNVQDLNVKEGDVVKIEPKVTDLDEDQITLTISNPVGDDGVWETAYTDHGEYLITITADDGKDKVVTRVNLVVEDVNKAPEIIDISLS